MLISMGVMIFHDSDPHNVDGGSVYDASSDICNGQRDI